MAKAYRASLLPGFLCLVFFFILNTPAVVRGAAPIDVDHNFGFNFYCKSGRWAPLSLVLKNRGPAVRAKLLVRVKQGNELNRDIVQTSYSKIADLPSGGVKQFYFDLLILSALHPVHIQLENEGEVLFSRSFSLGGRVTRKSMVLIPGRDGVFAPSLPDRFQTVVLRAETLPQSWLGYDGVSGVILAPSLVNQLRPKQVIALNTWVKNGGHLTVSGSMNYGIFSDSRIKSMLSFSVSGVETLSSLPALERFGNAPFNPGRDFWINMIDPVEKGQAIPLIFLGQDPLVVKRQQGLGTVLFMGFDPSHPAFVQWPGQKVFWRKLAALQPEKPEDPTGEPMRLGEDKVLDLLNRNFSDPFPGIAPVALGLVFYLVLVTLVLPLKPPMGFKRGLHITGFIILILVFSGGSFLVFRQRTEVRANVSFLRVSQNSPRLVHETYGGVFSPEAGIKEIAYGKNNVSVRALYPDFLSGVNRLETEIKPEEGRLTLVMKRFTSFFYKTRAYRDSGFRYKAQKDDGIVLTIDNFTGAPIVSGVIYYQRQFFPVGTLPADKRKIYRINTPDASGAVLSGKHVERMMMKGRENRADAQLARGLIRAVLDGLIGGNEGKPAEEKEDAALLCGWADTTGEPRLILWHMKI